MCFANFVEHSDTDQNVFLHLLSERKEILALLKGTNYVDILIFPNTLFHPHLNELWNKKKEIEKKLLKLCKLEKYAVELSEEDRESKINFLYDKKFQKLDSVKTLYFTKKIFENLGQNDLIVEANCELFSNIDEIDIINGKLETLEMFSSLSTFLMKEDLERMCKEGNCKGDFKDKQTFFNFKKKNNRKKNYGK